MKTLTKEIFVGNCPCKSFILKVVGWIIKIKKLMKMWKKERFFFSKYFDERSIHLKLVGYGNKILNQTQIENVFTARFFVYFRDFSCHAQITLGVGPNDVKSYCWYKYIWKLI